MHAATDNKVYSGDTNSGGSVTFSGLVGGDSVIASQSYGSRNVLGAGASTLAVNAGYVVNDGNGGNNYSKTVSTAAGTITQAALGLHAATDNKVYSGDTNSGGSVTFSGLVGGDSVIASQSYGSRNVLGAGASTLAVNAGYVVNDGNGGNNYSKTTNTAAGTITRLASVTWIGGPSGNWSLASNWAGGAIPDFANVAHVIIPGGAVVNFDSSIPALSGAVRLDSISSAGGLNVNSGSLTVAGMLATGSYVQSGGLVSAANLVASNNFKQTGGSLTVAGLVDITQAGGAAELGNIDAHDLIVNSAGGVTQASGAALAIAGEATLDTGAGDITLDNAGNDFGTVAVTHANNVVLRDDDALILGASTVQGNLTIASGALTQAGSTALAVAGTTTLATGGSDITLANANNDVGTVAVTHANNVTLTDKTALVLGASTIAGNLTVASGALTQSGALSVSGTTTLATGGSDVTLANAGNDFGTVAVTNANNVSLTDKNALVLGGSTISGNLSIASGALTQAAGATLAVAGTTTLNANGADVNLGNTGNDFAAVVVNNANDVTLQDANALILGASAINGNLSIASGALSQSAGATLAVAGATTVNANGANVTLANAGNDFGTVAVTHANDVMLRDANALTLGGSVINGNLSIASGALTQAPGSTLIVAGATTLNAGGANVSLGNAGNDFAAVLISHANDVILTDGNALVLGSSAINGNLTIASGALAQVAGATLAVAGTTTVNANGANVTLGNAGNDFSTVAVTNANDVMLGDANALNLGASAIKGNLSIDSGALTQATGATLTAAGETSLNANGANVILGNAGNDFTTIAVNNAVDVTLTDRNALNLASSSIGGNLNILAGGISQSAASALTVAGSSTLNAGAGDVVLNNAGNDFIGPVGATGLDVTLYDKNTLTLSTVKATVANLNARNELQVAANGEIQAKSINLFLGQDTGEAVGNAIDYFNVQADAVVTLRAGALSVTLKDASFFSANGNNALLPTFAFADDATQNLYADSTIRLFLNGIQINDSIKRAGITSSQTAIVQMLQATQKKADSKSDAIERGIAHDLSERGVYPHAGVLKLKMPPCDAGNSSPSDCE